MSAALMPVESAEIDQPGADVASLVAARIDAFERWLPEAIEAEATDELGRLIHDADLAALDQRRRGYEATAVRLTRLKMQAEAAIGLVDTRRFPFGAELRWREVALIIGGIEVSGPRRLRWRQLGVALERGYLEQVLTRCLENSVLVSQVIARAGISSVPAAVFRSEVKDAYARLGTWAALESALGVNRRVLQRIARGDDWSLLWGSAKPIAEALGMDLSALPLGSLKSAGGSPKGGRRFLVRERKPTGSKWDKAYGQYRMFLATFGQLAPDQDPVWDEAYGHLYEIEKILGQQMKREALR